MSLYAGDASKPIVQACLTVHEILDHLARHGGESPALLTFDRPNLTYADLGRRIATMRSWLSERGYGKSDRVAIVLPAGPELAACLLSTMALAVAAPLNPACTPDEFEFFLADMRATAVIVPAGWDNPLRAVARNLGVAVIELRAEPSGAAGAFALEGPAVAQAAPILEKTPDDIAFLLHSSGTTSRPKLVPTTNSQTVHRARTTVRCCALVAADRGLGIMPLFHAHGVQTVLLGSLLSGGSLAIGGDFDPDRFFDLLRTFRPTWYSAGFAHHGAIARRMDQHPEAVREARLRLIHSGSGRIEADALRALEDGFGAPVVEYYSSTETGTMASNPLPPLPRKPGTVGRPVDDNVQLVEDGGRPVAAGQMGEIAVRGPSILTAYENNQEANATCFRDGWFRTGDLGRLDADGYLTLTGRVKDIINRGGQKVLPDEVDGVLKGVPSIAEAATFAIPHPTLGEDVAAAVVPRPGQAVAYASIQDHLVRRLSTFKWPRRIFLVADLPKGSTGKISRDQLAARYGRGELTVRLRPGDGGEYGAEDVAERMRGLFADALDRDAQSIADDDDFFDLGGDSLSATRLMLAVEAAFQWNLDFDILFASPTPIGLARRMLRREAAGDGALVEMRAGAPGVAVVLIHPRSGEVFRFFPLVRLLEPGFPVYGLRYRAAEAGPGDVTVAGLAEAYLDVLRRNDVAGPLLLVGLSFGAAVAFHMAGSLRRSNAPVAGVILIDQAVSGHGSSWWPVVRHLKESATLPPYERLGLLARRARNFVLQSLNRVRNGPVLRQGDMAADVQRFRMAATRARRGYRPPDYDGDVTLVRATAETLPWCRKGDMGWRPFVSGHLTCVDIDATHDTIMLPPAVDSVAEIVVRMLRAS